VKCVARVLFAGGLTLTALVGVTAAVGCGYSIGSHGDGSSGYDGPSVPLRLDTVENQITPPRPGFEYDFTRRLKDEVALDRRYEFAGGAAATGVRIVLTEFDEPALVRDFANKQTEVALSAGVRIRITTGRDTREAATTAHASYAPGLGESRNAGLDRLWRNLARNVIDQIADRDWAKDEKRDAAAEHSSAKAAAPNSESTGTDRAKTGAQ
jgi:hypothetical protein